MNIKKQIENLTSKDAWLVNQAIENICLYWTVEELKEAVKVAKKAGLRQDLLKILEDQLLLDTASAGVFNS